MRDQHCRYRTGAALTIGFCTLLAASLACGAAAPPEAAALVRDHCASCHGETLAGGAGPALAGPAFTMRWSGNPAALVDLISTTMPPNETGSLSKDEYRAISLYLLAQSAKVGALMASDAPDVPLPAAPRIVGTASTEGPDDRELLRSDDADWLTYNRDYRSQRYSPLSQITPQNVASLAPKCILQLG
jgi:mono/diheme cytochrome c family protein